MRIQLLCDHKWRDLPNLAAIKLKLQALGHRVLISTTKDAVPMMQSFRPDCVVFNHLFGRTYAELSANLRNSGIFVAMLPTEGAMRAEFAGIAAGEFADFSACDLFLNWSEPAAERLRRQQGVDELVAPMVGCTRFDFYHPRFAPAVTPRDAFCAQYGLDPSKPIVTWATQYGYAHVVGDAEAMAKYRHETADVGVKACCERIGVPVEAIPRQHAEGRQASSDAFFSVASRLPDVQFIIRPHPVEDRNFYRKEIADRALDNVRFCPTDYIWNVLNASDVHLHRQCTTAVEAWTWNKPTVEMTMDYAKEWEWPEREQGSDPAGDADELYQVIRSYLDGRKVEADRQAHRNEHIRTWFGPMDGQRCAAAAQALHDALMRRGRTRRYFDTLGKVRTSPRAAATALSRYALGKLPNEPLLRRAAKKSSGPEDKLITRRDVSAYSRLIVGAI